MVVGRGRDCRPRARLVPLELILGRMNGPCLEPSGQGSRDGLEATKEDHMRYQLTRRQHPAGSGRWISSRWTIRIVAVPDGATVPDLRSPGVRVLWESPVLAEYYSHGGTTLTAFTRRYLDGFDPDAVAEKLGITLA